MRKPSLHYHEDLVARERPRTPPATRLCDYVSDWDFFSSADGQPWAGPTRDVAHTLFPLHGPGLRRYLLDRYSREYYGPPTHAALRAALAALDARARSRFDDGPTPALRVSSQPDPFTISIHTGRDSSGYQVSSAGCFQASDFKFVMGRGALALPELITEPDPSALASFCRLLRLSTRHDWIRCLTWLLAAFRPQSPFPILIIQGNNSSGKSHTARALRSLIDPHVAPLNPLPATSRRIHQLACDN